MSALTIAPPEVANYNYSNPDTIFGMRLEL